MATSTKNTLKEECTNCHEIYLTNMAELQRTWISNCPTCVDASAKAFTKAVNEAYTMFKKAGA